MALKREDAERALIVIEWERIEGARPGGGEVFAELGAAGLARYIYGFAVLGNVNLFFRKRGPLQHFLQQLDGGITGIDLRQAGHGLQMNAAPLFERDRGAVIGKNGLSIVDDYLQDATDIEGRGNLAAYFYQGFQNFDFAFRLQQAGIVQGVAGGLADIAQQKLIVFVEGQTVQAIGRFDHADQRVPVHERRGKKREDRSVFALNSNTGVPLLKTRVFRIVDQDGFAVVRDVAGNSVAWVLERFQLDRRIIPGAPHQPDRVTVHHPHIYRLRSQDFVELGRNRVQQGIEIEVRVEDLFQVIHLGDAADGLQTGIALALVGERD